MLAAVEEMVHSLVDHIALEEEAVIKVVRVGALEGVVHIQQEAGSVCKEHC